MLPHTLEELDRIRKECKALVNRRAGLSAGAAVIPLPAVDIGADVTLLLDMIPTINDNFGLTPEQIEKLNPEMKKLVFVAVTSLGTELVGKIITRQAVIQLLQQLGIRIATKSMVKFVPLVGQAVAAAISFGAMKWIGETHIKDCYSIVQQTLSGRTPVTIEHTDIS